MGPHNYDSPSRHSGGLVPQISVTNDLARLAGGRFVTAVESEGRRRLAEALVKQ